MKKIVIGFFDTSEGDAGDGYYFKIADHELKQRKQLEELIEEIITDPSILKEYSTKCKKFVEDNYSFEKQSKEIIETATNSTFAGLNYPVYRRNLSIRLTYLTYYKIKKLKFLFSAGDLKNV